MKNALRFLDYSIDYLKEWFELTLKLLGFLTIGVAVWAIQEPNVTLNKESEISILDMKSFFKKIDSDFKLEGVEKRFYDSLSKGKPFERLSWVSYVADQNELRPCSSRKEPVQDDVLFSDEQLKEEHEKDARIEVERIERFAETAAGYGKDEAVKELIERLQTCAHYDLIKLGRFLGTAYGVPRDSIIDYNNDNMPKQFYEDPVYPLIKSFSDLFTRKILFEELPWHRKIVTILKLENTGSLEAREVKVRFNFFVAGVKTTEDMTLSNGRQEWQFLKEPIYLEGGSLSENYSNGAEVFYSVIPAQSKRFIYVITNKNTLQTGTFYLEPTPYLARIPRIPIWSFILLCVSTAIIAIRVFIRKRLSEASRQVISDMREKE